MHIIIGRKYPDEIMRAVKEARQSILILMYDWRWYANEPGARIQRFNQEILTAVRRGVRVVVRLNNAVNFESKMNVRNFVAQPLKAGGVDVKSVISKKTMHVKMVIVDEKNVFLGSHNLTKNAFELNHEISIFTDDTEAVTECIAFFKAIE